MYKPDYLKSAKITNGQQLAWKTGGMKYLLGLLIREFGYEKVKACLEDVKEKPFTFEV